MSHELACEHWIDTDAYSDRDRLMFAAGVEFGNVLYHIRFSEDKFIGLIHKENESRVRMACGTFGRRCEIEACGPEEDGREVWSYLTIEARCSA
jgi:hypothetical protein